MTPILPHMKRQSRLKMSGEYGNEGERGTIFLSDRNKGGLRELNLH